MPKVKSINPTGNTLPKGIFFRPDRPKPFQVRTKRGSISLNESFVSRNDAIARLKTFTADFERGLWRDTTAADRMTVEQAFERYEREIIPKKRGGKYEIYRIRALQSAFGKKSLSRLAPADIAKWRDDEERRDIAPSTIIKSLALISHLYSVAKREWAMPALINPIEGVRKPTVRNERKRRLVDDEQQRLEAALSNSGKGALANIWVLPLAILAIESAARQSELLSLVWKDVNLDTRVMRLKGIGGTITKNGEPYRDIPLSERAKSILEGLPRSSERRVFPTTASAIAQSWRRACKRAGIENLRFHDLRHEATSRLADIFAVHKLAKITGHKDMRMLMRYYHPRAEELAKEF